MCRILYFSGDTDSLPTATVFIDSLVDASYDDILAPSTPFQHKDGFGFVVFGEVRGQKEEFTFKSVKPIFKADEDIDNLKRILKKFDRFALGIHSRKASMGSVNTYNAHPYCFSTRQGITLFFMHNGTLLKEKLQETLKINFENDFTDSYLFGLMMARKLTKLNNSSFVDFFKYSLPFIGSTLNTITMFASVDNKFGAFMTAYSKKESDYTQLFTYKRENAYAFASSTVYSYAKGKGVLMDRVANGTTLFIEDVLSDSVIENSALEE